MWKEGIRNIHTFVALALVCVAGASFVASLGWPFEVASHFPVHLAVVALLVAAWCAYKKAGEATILALAVFAVQLSVVVPLFLEQNATSEPGDFRVLTANVLYKSDDYDAMMDLIATEDPDIVIIVEETPSWRDGLSALATSYAYQEHSGATARVRGMSGVGVYSKTPLAVLPLDSVPHRDERPALALATTLEGKEVTFVAVHPWTPHTPGTYAKRNAQLAALAEFTASRGEHAIMVGDMNITPQSPDFGPLLASYDLESAREGRVWAPSWPAPLGWLGIPIDHAFVTGGIEVSDFRMGPFIGSDHYPTILDFSVEVDGR